nr:kinesin-like protein KIN-7D, mitochondrial isoform X2 [Ipomoea batatas]
MLRQQRSSSFRPHSTTHRQRRTGSDALGSRTNMLNPSSLTSLSPKPILISSNPFSPSQHQRDSATVIRRCQERMEKQIHHHHLTPPRTDGETDLLPSSDAAKNGWRNRSATIIRCRQERMEKQIRHHRPSPGTYVEGIKEEVVLSPGHALSFIAAGEGLPCLIGFEMMIESSAHGDDYDGVIFSQLNLIDLAGSESSKTETTGLRRKDINKSLLTLGTDMLFTAVEVA